MADTVFPPAPTTTAELATDPSFVANMITSMTNAVHAGTAPASDVITVEISGSGSLELAQAEW